MSNIKHSYPGHWGAIGHRDGDFICGGDRYEPPPDGNAAASGIYAFTIGAAVIGAVMLIVHLIRG